MNTNLTKEQGDDIRELSNELRAIRENDLSFVKTVIKLGEVTGSLIRISQKVIDNENQKP